MSKYIVRYGTMRSIGVMATRSESAFRRGMEVVVRTDRGLEVGQVLCESTEDALSHLDQPAHGTIVRAVNEEDAEEINTIDQTRISNIDTCRDHAQRLGLEMKLVEVEQLLGRQRMIVYYLSDNRVDFRELVKVLANEFKTRIEMKQIGVRDEAKLMADYGDCGKPVCCNNHLVKMPPVSMKMAKLQKASLDPTKISGRCGRLKCCLRYEFDTYLDIQRELPKVGSHVVTRNGKAKVIAQQIIAQQLLVETEDHRRILIEASEVLSVMRQGNANLDSPKAAQDARSRTSDFPAKDSKLKRGKSTGGKSTGGKSTATRHNQSDTKPAAKPPSSAPPSSRNPGATQQASDRLGGAEENGSLNLPPTGDPQESKTSDLPTGQPTKKKRRRSRRRRNRNDPPPT